MGEVKWGEVIDHHHLQRLATARDLLRPKGYDTETTVLALYGSAGFTAELTAAAAGDNRITLVDFDRLYSWPGQAAIQADPSTNSGWPGTTSGWVPPKTWVNAQATSGTPYGAM